MKKIFLITALALSLVLCACGGDEVSNAPSESKPDAPAVSVDPEQSVPEDISQPEQSADDISLPAETDYETAQVNASGHFLSDYGCGIDIEVIWTLESVSEGKVLYTAEVFLISYSVKVGARFSDCYVAVNEEKVYFTSPVLDVEDCDKPVRTHLATVEKELELSYDTHTYAVSVSFPFRGTYNGVALPKLEAVTVINVQSDGTVES
ncbi:MAG: hypothetical protein IKT37_04595 [Clostridia bacterium]|nr:hypothetical protein [Clostridia bacterium]